jgi:diguanylate cyclase (GGDEF)-like protein
MLGAMRWGDRGDARQDRVLAMLARALGAASDERRAGIVVRRYASGVCGADHVALIACGPERGHATLRDPGDDFPGLAAGAMPAGTCLTVRLGRPHARCRGDAPLLGCDLCGRIDLDTACAPLTAAGAVVGAVLVTGRCLTDDASERLDEIAAIAGPAIAGLRAFDLASAHSHTDALTGLPNRRAAENAAERMVALGRRCAQAVTAIRVDIDGIAVLTDRFGGEAGDSVVQSLAAILRARLRASDLVARVGADEFLAVLPDTGSTEAVALGEGLRRLAREFTPSGSPDPVTVSVGVASFPVDAEAGAELLAAAERALLAAQTAGGDRVTVLSPPDPWELLSG